MVDLEGFADEWGPEKVLQVYDPQMEMQGILVIDNTALGPGKGGIGMTPSVSTEEVFRLSRIMTWKCALAELPLGGAKSGIIASMTSSRRMIPYLMKHSKEDLIYVRDFIEAGKVTSVIDRRYPLSEVAEAHRYVEKGHARGKVIITM